LLALLDEAQDRAADPGADPQEALDATTTKLLDLQRSTVGQQARSATEIALARLDHWEALAAGKARSGWPTHHTRLNGMLGGLRPGALYYFAARPAVGKSSFALELAARSGLKSLFLSLEMAADELIDRAVAGLGRVAYSALQTGRLRDDGGGGSDWGRVAEAVGSPGMRLLFIDDQPALTLSQIRAKAKSVPGLQLLVLDYLQLCSGSAGPGANRNAEIEQISRGLKALAKELGIAVVALSQLNRGVEARTDKRPMLADLRDSGSIEQDADSVLMLWTARELPDGQRVVGLSVAKNRHGRTGTLALRFDGEHQSWAESDDDLTPSAAPRGLGGFRDGD
jgi:replicative DNA helicase